MNTYIGIYTIRLDMQLIRFCQIKIIPLSFRPKKVNEKRLRMRKPSFYAY